MNFGELVIFLVGVDVLELGFEFKLWCSVLTFLTVFGVLGLEPGPETCFPFLKALGILVMSKPELPSSSLS